MATIKYFLRQSTSDLESFGLYIKITKDRQRKVISLKKTCTKKDWDEKKEEFRKSFPNAKAENLNLASFKIKIQTILNDAFLQKREITLDELESELINKRNKSKLSLFQFWKFKIENYKSMGKFRNSMIYHDAFITLKKFIDNREIDYKDLNYTLLKGLESFMRANNNKDTTISVRMRTIRALYNDAIKNEYTSKDNYPFDKYSISKLNTKTRKRALDIESFERLKQFDVKCHPQYTDSFNYFLFSYYMRGMNFIDMAKLTWENLQNDSIFYLRSKTKKPFKIRIRPEVAEIIEYYKVNYPSEKYILPILNKADLKPIQIYYRQQKMLRRFNKEIKEIAKICGIDSNITSYVIRHTLGNNLKKAGASITVIKEVYGHDEEKTTNIYLNEINPEELDNQIDLYL
ncbi:MAG: phage integrase SAM-like domain-containing protein [Chitinophagales bacterium]|jgi:integrase/recombinase XerD|nr:site-specific integrase [Sphingobacteriales bacterium]